MIISIVPGLYFSYICKCKPYIQCYTLHIQVTVICIFLNISSHIVNISSFAYFGQFLQFFGIFLHILHELKQIGIT